MPIAVQATATAQVVQIIVITAIRQGITMLPGPIIIYLQVIMPDIPIPRGQITFFLAPMQAMPTPQGLITSLVELTPVTPILLAPIIPLMGIMQVIIIQPAVITASTVFIRGTPIALAAAILFSE